MKLLSLPAALLLAASGAAAQVGNGSFENGPTGSAPSGWNVNDNGTVVLPSGSCFSEALLGFPSDGSNWCKVDAGSSSGVTIANHLLAASHLEQTFTLGQTSDTTLALDVTFVSAETPGNSTYNDILVVEVRALGSTSVLATVDVATGSFPNTSLCGTRPATDLMNLSVDLAAAFPGLTGSTPVTLGVYVGNGNDGAFDSWAYVDNARITGTGQVAPFDVGLVDQGGDMYLLTTTGTNLPNAEIYNFFSFALSNPLGSGPFFGLEPDSFLLQQIFLPLGTHPFHVTLDAQGTYQFGPVPLDPAQVSMDYMSLALTGGVPTDWTPVHRF